MLVESIPTSVHGNEASHRKLPRRDWFLLPLLSVATVLIVLGAAEILARHFWPAQEEDNCFSDGRFVPHCSATVKIPEGLWSVDSYNDCGYRSTHSCHKDASEFRIVLLGSSAAHGLYLPYENTFGALAERQMSNAHNRRVDVQNLGIPNTTPDEWLRRMDEILSLEPSAVVFTVTPFDVEQIGTRTQKTSESQRPPGIYKRLQHTLTQSRAALVAQHVIFSDTERFLRFYLLYGDRADFLRLPLTPEWQSRYAQLDDIISKAAARFQAAHISFYLLVLPSRAEAALLRVNPRPRSTNPFSFRDHVGAIALSHHVGMIDCVSAFSQRPAPEKLFYVVDGHITPEGQALIAKQMGKEIHVQ